MKCIALSEGMHGGTKRVYGEPASDYTQTCMKSSINGVRPLLTSGVAGGTHYDNYTTI